MKNYNLPKHLTAVPTTTLNALKNMLFTKNGIDLKNIIDDISVGFANEDLAAINIALTHLGIKPEICQKSRYQKEYKNRFHRYDFVKFSQIFGVVQTKSILCELTDDGVQELREECVANLPVETWLNLDTDIKTFLSTLK